jgi:hypothetical protein
MPYTQTGACQRNAINIVGWLTYLNAPIELKGLSGAVANPGKIG